MDIEIEALLNAVSALVLLVSMVLALMSLWRERAALAASAKAIALYVLHCAVGLAIVLFLVDGPKPTEKALALTAFLLAWIILGALWMARNVPREHALPRWMGERWGTIDYIVGGFAAIALAAYFA